MPSLLGAGSEFIPVESIATYHNEVMKLDQLTSDSTLLGYIYGGISSTAANIFTTNNGTQSSASSQIFSVYLVNKSTSGIDQLNAQSASTLQLQIYPNPNRGKFEIKYYLENAQTITISIHNAEGKLLWETQQDALQGENNFTKTANGLIYGGGVNGLVYVITLKTATETATQRIIVQ